MHHTFVEQLKRDEEAAKTMLVRVALTSGVLLTAVLVIVIVAATFMVMR